MGYAAQAITKTIVEIEDSVLTTPATSVLPAGSVRPLAVQHQSPASDRPAAARFRTRARARAASDFTGLARQVQEAGLMRRRYGYYGSRLVDHIQVVRHLNTVGPNGDDPFPCPLVAIRRALRAAPVRSMQASR